MYDWSGTVLNELTVLKRTEEYQGSSPKYLCKCTCGKTCLKSARDLAGGAFACGNCNYRSSPEYSILSGIRQRCTNSKTPEYKYYGGRGILICDRWAGPMRASIRNFIEDMGVRPSPELSIDRINVNGNYTKENCRWATSKEQAANKRPDTSAGRILTGLDYYKLFMSTGHSRDLSKQFGISKQLVDNLRGGYYHQIAYDSIAKVMGLEIPTPFSKLKFVRLQLLTKPPFLSE